MKTVSNVWNNLFTDHLCDLIKKYHTILSRNWETTNHLLEIYDVEIHKIYRILNKPQINTM